MHDWAEVHRLAVAGKTTTDIAEALGMSRNTVTRLRALSSPPAYERPSPGSLLDPHKDTIAALLDDDAEAPATAIIEHLRRDGYRGGITILKGYLATVRPQFLAAKHYQRTTYLPGEIGQFDWWHTGLAVPVGKGRCREAMGLVGSLPHSAGHAVVYTFSRTTADFCTGFAGCLSRLGGTPDKAVFDNDTSIVASRTGGKVRLHSEVDALLGHFGIQAVVLRPRTPESKGQVERLISYLQTSFIPLRSFDDLTDLQAQSDAWNLEVAQRRHLRRLGATVGEALAVERSFLHALPAEAPDLYARLEVRVSKDSFVRVAGADYSVPPGYAGRRVSVRLSLWEVVVFCDHQRIAAHRRSYVPADVVIDPAHARALRLAREAKARLERSDVEMPTVDLSVYDTVVTP
ncbi:MAG TPA: IS21 family transposase [Actinomycetota bacterium]|nr:IS21 family transposase [Actinomycetota bacterium]